MAIYVDLDVIFQWVIHPVLTEETDVAETSGFQGRTGWITY
jgi:hypothetical protein